MALVVVAACTGVTPQPTSPAPTGATARCTKESHDAQRARLEAEAALEAEAIQAYHPFLDGRGACQRPAGTMSRAPRWADPRDRSVGVVDVRGTAGPRRDDRQATGD